MHLQKACGTCAPRTPPNPSSYALAEEQAGRRSRRLTTLLFITKSSDEIRDNDDNYRIFGFKDAASLHKVAAILRVKYRVDSHGNRGAQAKRERRHPLRVGDAPSKPGRQRIEQRSY